MWLKLISMIGVVVFTFAAIIALFLWNNIGENESLRKKCIELYNRHKILCKILIILVLVLSLFGIIETIYAAIM